MRLGTLVIGALIVVTVASVVAGAPAAHAGQATPEPGNRGFIGAWRVVFVIDDTPVGVNLTTFFPEGIMLASNLPALPTGADDAGGIVLQGASHGVWASSGERAIDITFVTLQSDAAGNLVATRTIRGSLELDPSGDAWHGVYTATVTDPAGEVVRVSEGSVEATRIVVEPMEALGTPVG